MKKILALFLFWIVCQSSVMAQACYSSSITNPVPFMGTGQETVTLTDGTKWKITDYTYLYLYSYYPSVTICPSTGKLTVGTNTFNVISASPVVVVPTTYTFQICNQSNVAVSAAYGRNDTATSTFMSHGWYNISAGACATVSSTSIRYRYFYVYAQSNGLVWQDSSGAYRFCIDTTNAFDLATGNCAARGYVEKAFYEIDTGTTSTSYTWNLTGTATVAPTIAAQFTTSTTSGVAPLAVNFTGAGSSTLVGDVLSYLWTFGDGTTSTLQSPSHTYSSAGSYGVTLKVSNATGQSATSTAQTITVTASTTSFTFRVCNQSTVPVFAAYSQVDTTVRDFVAHGWYSIEAGTCANLAVGTHTRYFYLYAQGAGLVWPSSSTGSYICVDPIKAFNVTDTAANCAALGLSNRNAIEIDTGTTGALYTYNLTGTATVAPTIAAQFTTSTTSGVAPLAVNFTGAGSSTLVGDVLSYLWTFGDGTTSTLQSPSHTYSTAGTFSATLKVSNATGQTATSAAKSITVTAAPAVITLTLTALPATGVAPLAVKFTGTGSSTVSTDVLSYLWTFGDGTTSTLQSPSHTYSTAGTFSATLKVTNATGQTATSAAQTITVTVEPAVIKSTFTATPDAGYRGLGCPLLRIRKQYPGV